MRVMANSHPRPAAARRTGGSHKPKYRRMRASERRPQLLDVARSVFARTGYFGTTMDDVAEAAGITKPILYQHFKSKKDLYLALIDEASHEIINAIWEATDGRYTSLERSRRGLRAYFDYVKDHPDSFRVLFSDAQADEEIDQRIDSVRMLIAERVTELILQSPDSAGIDREKAEILAVGMVGMTEMVGRVLVQPGKISAEKAALALGSLFVSGYSGD